MSRRRSFPSEGPRSNPPPKSRGPHTGSKPRPRPPGGPARDHAGPPRREAAAKPRLFKDGGGAETDKHDRLQKVLAHAGLGSRRGCEQLILQGRVAINGEVIRQLGTRVDPAGARITVDGEPIKLESMVYYAVNKPKGYVSTNSDPSGRPRVVDLLPEIPERVYTVGRLDEASTGLLILTNDGDLANRLAHPRYGVEKVYRALVAGLATAEMMAKLTEGVWLSDGKVRAKRARIVSRQGEATMLELVLAEGKKREIRRMLAKLGHKVMALNRIAVGPISLKGLSAGECRSLSRHEIELLRKVAAGDSVAPPRFFDGDSSRRPHAKSPRPRGSEQARAARNNEHSAPRHDHSPPRRPHQNAGGPPQRRPQPAQNENAEHAGSARPQHSRTRPSTSAVSNRPSSGAQKGRKGPPKPRSKTSKPVESRRPNASTSLPPEPLKPRRRIIGLALDSVAPNRPNVPGGGTRKRPPVRKRRPPGPVLGKKRNLSPKTDSRDDEDG